METNPKLSVIIPVYKVEPYLRQCLDSVIHQTYDNLEIIIVDDGSPDCCGEICDEYAEKDNRIQVIHKKNEGLCAARNEGICRVTGEWLTFVDSDDWCELNYYENIISQIVDPTVDVVCAGGQIRETPNGRHTYYADYADERNFYFCDKESIEKLQIMVLTSKRRFGVLAAPWDKLYRTEFLKGRRILFDPSCKALEDVWFNFQVFQEAQKVEGHLAVGYHYRKLSTSITGSYNPKRPKINYDLVCKLQDYALRHNKSDSMYNAIHAFALGLIKNTLPLYYFNPQNDKGRKKIKTEFNEMKSWPYFHEAIWNKENQYLNPKQIVLKYAFRLPWIWPLKLLFYSYEKLQTD